MHDVAKLIDLSHDLATVLLEVPDGAQSIRIHEHEGVRWVYTGGASVLSAFEVLAPGKLLFPNHHCMLCALLWREPVTRVLNLGFGVGSFERWFTEHLPTLECVSVDCSETLVRLSRQWFAIPGDWPVLIEPAHEFLRRDASSFDVILCDIFAKGAHASCLYEADFYAAAAQRLNSGGMLAMNLSPDSDSEMLTILLAMRTAFTHVALATVSEHGNVVVLASVDEPPANDELLRRAQRSAVSWQLDMSEWIERFTILPAREGGTARR